MFCFGTSVCWPELSGFLDKFNEKIQKNIEMVVSQVMSKFFIFFVFHLGMQYLPINVIASFGPQQFP